VDEEFKLIRRADIRIDQQGPGTVLKILIDDTGSHRFSQVVRLEIARNGANGSYYVFHITADGKGTDTWHDTLVETLDEAEAEYGVTREAWEDID
jgi:hypothetical protein